jgi:hypothetical protein
MATIVSIDRTQDILLRTQSGELLSSVSGCPRPNDPNCSENDRGEFRNLGVCENFIDCALTAADLTGIYLRAGAKLDRLNRSSFKSRLGGADHDFQISSAERQKNRPESLKKLRS